MKYLLLTLILLSGCNSRTDREQAILNEANCITTGMTLGHNGCEEYYRFLTHPVHPWALYRKTNIELFLIALFISPYGDEKLDPQKACESFSSKDNTLICFER